jgi:hypothetical protein
MKSAVSMLSEKIKGKPAIANRPQRSSFEEFLREDARVPIGGGEYGPYTFEGREAILEVVRLIDRITNERLADSTLAIAGGAQFGKTILELNYLAYAASQCHLAVGLYLPDVDLVDGVVDTKLRPDVIDQIPWFAEMIQVGKAVNKSGKAVNRKGAFMVTDGKRRGSGMVLGLGKVATSFTFDVTIQDEKDDIPEKNAIFVQGRRSSSKFRFSMIVGTQRVHSRGMYQAFMDGSQGVVEIAGLNPEDEFPGIIRCAVDGVSKRDDPKLTWAGDFRRDDAEGVTVATHNPKNFYYLADPVTGEPLDRRAPVWVHRNPEQIEMQNWSIRIAQLSIDAISLSQIVSQFQGAVADPAKMIVFRCDVLALPKSTAQALSPEITSRAMTIDPYEMRMKPEMGRRVYGGIDVGNLCWFWAREKESEKIKRLIYAASIASGDLIARAVSLFHQFGMSCICIDRGPETAMARQLALELNGLNHLKIWPSVPDKKEARLSLGSLSWNGPKGFWVGARCFVVSFTKKQIGAGIEHDFDIFVEGGKTKFVPLIKCNREDSIDRVVSEFLTPDEGVFETFPDGLVRSQPSMLLPRKTNKIIETVEKHLITGSERQKLPDCTKGDYVDECANHFLLADAYSALAEGEGSIAKATSGKFGRVAGNDRKARGLALRRDRRMLG